MGRKTDQDEVRRRSPLWVRSLGDAALHALTGKLDRELRYGDATARQEWLWGACLSELEYRGRRDRRDGIACCTCRYCMSPFPDIELPFDG